jgi:hypothetical protein
MVLRWLGLRFSTGLKRSDSATAGGCGSRFRTKACSPVVDVHHAPPHDILGVDVQPHKAGHLQQPVAYIHACRVSGMTSWEAAVLPLTPWPLTPTGTVTWLRMRLSGFRDRGRDKIQLATGAVQAHFTHRRDLAWRGRTDNVWSNRDLPSLHQCRMTGRNGLLGNTHLLWCKLVRVCLVDSQPLQPVQHHRGKGTLALLVGRTQTPAKTHQQRDKVNMRKSNIQGCACFKYPHSA